MGQARGKRCEPAYVKEISEVAVQVKNCSLEELSKQRARRRGSFLRIFFVVVLREIAR